MNTIYHSLVKAVAWVIRPHQTGHHLPDAGSSEDFQAFMSKIKSNAGRFKR
jgi:hypothetical protein